MLRILLETVISAILDAGLNPLELEGSNTGVFVGSCFSESEKCWFLDKLIPQGFALTGYTYRIIYYEREVLTI